MQLTPEEITRLAALARLDIAEGEAETFGAQLSAILDYVGLLSRADTDDVAPLEHVAPVANVLRPDAVAPSTPDVRDALVAAFPEHEDDLLKVKAVFS